MTEWENGEIMSEPLTQIATDYPITCAIYARENGLLHTRGWKRFKSIANRQNKLFRIMVKNIRCDNAGENLTLEKDCRNDGLGIQFEFPAPGTPQQNGKVE